MSFKSFYEDYKKKKTEEDEEKKKSISESVSDGSFKSFLKKNANDVYKDEVTDLDDESISDRFKAWQSSLSSLNSSASNFSADTWKDSSYFSSYYRDTNNVLSEGRKIYNYLLDKGDLDTAITVKDALDTFSEFKSGINSATKYYAQWGSQKEWDDWNLWKDIDIGSAKTEIDKLEEQLAIERQSQHPSYGYLDSLKESVEKKKADLYNATYLQSKNFTLDDLENYSKLYGNDIAYSTSDGANVTWNALYNQRKVEEENNALYEAYSARPDWTENSKYISTKTNGYFNADVTYEEVNDPAGLRYGGGAATGMSNSTFGWLMTDKEKQLYNYIYHSEGAEAANKFHEKIKPELQNRRDQVVVDAFKEVAGVAPVTSTILSALATPVAAVEALGDIFNFVAKGPDSVDRNLASAVQSTIRGTVQENVDWNIGDWDAFDFLYGTGTSLLDMGVASV